MTTPLFHPDSFSGREGEVFRVHPDPPMAEVELTLASVTTWGAAAVEGERQPFTLVLHGPLEPVLAQRTYRFDHGELGAFDMFIVPIGPRQEAMQYEAVFG